MQGQGKREIPEKIRRPAASYSAIPTCKNLEMTPPRTVPDYSPPAKGKRARFPAGSTQIFTLENEADVAVGRWVISGFSRLTHRYIPHGVPAGPLWAGSEYERAKFAGHVHQAPRRVTGGARWRHTSLLGPLPPHRRRLGAPLEARGRRDVMPTPFPFKHFYEILEDESLRAGEPTTAGRRRCCGIARCVGESARIERFWATLNIGEPGSIPGGVTPRNFRVWLSCRSMPLFDGVFLRISPSTPSLAFRRCYILTLVHPRRLSIKTLLRRGWKAVSIKQRRNARAGKTEDPGENPLTSGIVRHDSHVRKSGSDPAGNRARFGLSERRGPGRGLTLRLPPTYYYVAWNYVTSPAVFIKFSARQRRVMNVCKCAQLNGLTPRRLGFEPRRIRFANVVDVANWWLFRFLDIAFNRIANPCSTVLDWIGKRLLMTPGVMPESLSGDGLKTDFRPNIHQYPYLTLDATPGPPALQPGGAPIDCTTGASWTAVAQWIERSPPTKAKRVLFPTGPLHDVHMYESCRMMPLVYGFSRGYSSSPAPAFQRCFMITSLRRWSVAEKQATSRGRFNNTTAFLGNTKCTLRPAEQRAKRLPHRTAVGSRWGDTGCSDSRSRERRSALDVPHTSA
ncbi:hypothetical protein PR048_022228 [Dryococelus australis]|uniref:Uncharacterized protein n=1 Tax=Dryococelus australis TaxID=614101 RepID=A0ABQ9H0H0_9NEOP|nr:hypothetical protein PR048_022228 [Dryococelus australis]